RVDVDRVEGTGGRLGQEREALDGHVRLAGQGQRRLDLAGHPVLGVGFGSAVPAHQHQDDDEQGDPRPPASAPAHPRWRCLVILSGRDTLVGGIRRGPWRSLVALVPRMVLILLIPRAGRETGTGWVPLAGLVLLVRRVSLVGLVSLAGREGRPGR